MAAKAVTEDVYNEHFQHVAVEKVIQRYQLKILIFDLIPKKY